MSCRINALINALCVKNGILRKSKIIKIKKYKNTVEPMFVHELTKKIANNLKGWSVSLNILIRPFAEEVLENAKITLAGLHCENVI